MKIGKVWLVGAGPSDAGLFTLKGKAVLEQADVVVYDHLVGSGIMQMIPEHAECIDVGKVSGNHKVPQEQINEILLEQALAGKRVVRLKGGDPFLFGRGGEELELLVENGVPFEVVPGITSALSVPAYAGIPVTHRDFTPSLHIVTAHRKRGDDTPVDYAALAALGQVTLVFLMGVSALPDICSGLIRAGKPSGTPAAVLEKGTTFAQRRVVGTLETLPELAKLEQIGTPGLIVVGEVCTLAERFHWAEDRPLGGARVVVTRPQNKASGLGALLYERGAEVLYLPAIRTEPLCPCVDLERLKDRLSDYAWFVFSSTAGVEALFGWMREMKLDIRSLSGIRLAAVGAATEAALAAHGLLVDYRPAQFNGGALAEGLAPLIGQGERVLAFVPENTESHSVSALREHGVLCDTAQVYRTVLTESEPPELTESDIIAFTSASTVKGFAHICRELDFSRVQAVCIGKQTAEEAKKYGMRVTVSAEATLSSMADTITQLYQNQKGMQKI